jgi:hypothetical protein
MAELFVSEVKEIKCFCCNSYCSWISFLFCCNWSNSWHLVHQREIRTLPLIIPKSKKITVIQSQRSKLNCLTVFFFFLWSIHFSRDYFPKLSVIFKAALTFSIISELATPIRFSPINRNFLLTVWR